MPFDVVSFAFAKKFKWREITVKTIQLTQVILDDMEVGEDISKYQLVTLKEGKLFVASIDDPERMPVVGIALEDGSVGDTISILDEGSITNPAWTFATGVTLYAGLNGEITSTPPSTVGHFVQIVGKSLGGNRIYFDPDKTYWRIG